MAVIEIGAATLPGFPYYFPYRTGVRANATPVANGGPIRLLDATVLITASAAVTSARTANVDSVLAVTATAAADSYVSRYADSSAPLEASISAAINQGQALSADLALVASITSGTSRNQELSTATPLSVTTPSALQLQGVSGTGIVEIAAGITADASLQAVSSASLALTTAITAAGYLSATSSANTAITAVVNSSVLRAQFIAADTAVTIDTPTLASQDSLTSADIVITAGLDNALVRIQYLDAELALIAGIDARVTNISAALSVIADFTADVQLNQAATATLEVSATALADALDTRYADAALSVIATAASDLKLDPGYQFYLDIIAPAVADSLRTVYATVGTLNITALLLSDSSLNALGNTSLNIAASTAADSEVTRYGSATLEVHANGTAEVSRATYASAEAPIVALPDVVALRITYAVAPDLDVIAGISALNQLQAPLLAETIGISAFFGTPDMQGQFVSTADLELLTSSFPEDNAHFLTAATLKGIADFPTQGGLILLAEAELSIAATLSEVEALRELWMDTLLEISVAIEVGQIQFIHSADADLALLVENPASMLYRRSGGNPMWLTFFYGGNGRQYPVAVPSSGEE